MANELCESCYEEKATHAGLCWICINDRTSAPDDNEDSPTDES